MSDEYVFRYTRAQAIADGVLVDVTEAARQTGFRFPLALTAEVWSRYVAVPEGAVGQDERGRLHDILWMLLVAIRRTPSRPREPLSELIFPVLVANGPGPAEEVTLKAVCGPGDDPAPVLTIMLETED